MRKILTIALLALVLLTIPLIASAAQESPLQRTINAGWFCGDIAGAMHCFDPGDAHSQNTASRNVKVFDYAADGGGFQGTEQLWSTNLHEELPCPQDHLLDLRPEMPFIACHHYSHES